MQIRVQIATHNPSTNPPRKPALTTKTRRCGLDGKSRGDYKNAAMNISFPITPVFPIHGCWLSDYVGHVDVVWRKALLISLPHTRKALLSVCDPAFCVEEWKCIPVINCLKAFYDSHISVRIDSERYSQLFVFLWRCADQLLQIRSLYTKKIIQCSVRTLSQKKSIKSSTYE